jgi:diguanylate cyclase (GGDEF)-like protein
MVVGERLRQAVGSTPISTDAGGLTVHISVGVATLTDDDANLVAVLHRADTALYLAKDGGRDRVVRAD